MIIIEYLTESIPNSMSLPVISIKACHGSTYGVIHKYGIRFCYIDVSRRILYLTRHVNQLDAIRYVI